MKIAFAADVHGRGKDLTSLALQFSAMIQACNAHDVKMLIFPGDVFEKPNIADRHASTGAISRVVIGAIVEFLNGDPDRRSVKMIPGNHDIAGSGSADALHVFDGMNGVEIIREPCTVLYPLLRIHYFPWQWSGSAEVALRDMNIDSSFIGHRSLFVGHANVIGMLMNTAKKCDPGGVWVLPRKMVESLPVDHVAMGHYHKRQPFFVGAFRQTDFGEMGNPAGIEIWDTETNAVEWVELDGAPRYFQEEISANELNTRQGAWPLMDGAAKGIDHFRLKVLDGQPDPAVADRMAKQGVELRRLPEQAERIRRADVRPGILEDDRALIALHAENQEPPITGERLARMNRVYDELFDEKEVCESPSPQVEEPTAGAPF